MGLVPAEKEFLIELQNICRENGALLIFDEVMSGFRASSKGAQGIYPEIKPDLVTFGKVIGAGMPVGAFGGRAEIMSHLSPEGSVYQAGTLSGNPIAMNAGNKMLEILTSEAETIYPTLTKRAEKLVLGLKNIAEKNGIPLQVDFRGSMFGYFFNENPVKNFDDALKSNLERFAKFHKLMLENGIYLAPSQFEAGFISTQTTDEMIDKTLEVAEQVFPKL